MAHKDPVKRAAYQARWKAGHPDQMNAYKNTRQTRARQLLWSLKEGQPCADCGGLFHPCQMDFDHRPGEVKAFNIGTRASGHLADVMAEVSKCDLVCANCHRMRTVWDRASRNVKFKPLWVVS